MTTDDLLAEIETAAGRDAAAAVRTFVEQPGVPRVEARLECSKPSPQLRLRQSRDVPLGGSAEARTWHVPVCARYPSGAATAEQCVLLREIEASLPLPGAKCDAWVMPNARGLGYYRWSSPAVELRRIGKHAVALDVPERISLVESVASGWERGEVTPEDALAVLEPLAADSDPTVAGGAMRVLRSARAWLADEVDVARAIEEHGRRLYAGPAATVGWKADGAEPPERDSLRDRLLRFLVWSAREPVLRAEVAKSGAGYLAGEPESFPLDIALPIAVSDGGEGTFDAALARLPKAGTNERKRLLRALGAARRPDLVERARTLALSDARIAAWEVVELLSSMMSVTEHREATWEWIGKNLAAFRARVWAEHLAWLPTVALSLCDARRAEEVRTWFAPIAHLPGAARRIADTAERIRMCAARRQALVEPLRRHFTPKRR